MFGELYLGAPAFRKSDDLVHFGNGEFFFHTAGPMNFNQVDGRGVAETKVNAWVVSRSEAAAGEYVSPLLPAVCGEVDRSSGGIPGALWPPCEFQFNPMMVVGRHVA